MEEIEKILDEYGITNEYSEEMRNKIKAAKNECVKNNKWDAAAYLRDMERKLEVELFLKFPVTKKIVDVRNSGKTTRLIKMSAETGAYIVCDNPHYVASMAESLNYNIPFPLSYYEFVEHKYYGKNMKGFLIDEIGHLAQYIAKDIKILGLTMSTE